MRVNKTTIITFDNQWVRKNPSSFMTLCQVHYQRSLLGLHEIFIAILGLRWHIQVWK